MEQKLIQYIIEKYNPVAVLLHGSRASGFDRLHSDWDFAILVAEDIKTEREIIDGQNIEIRALKLPLDEEKISDKWIVLRKGNVKALFDPQNIAEEIIEKVTIHYIKPLQCSKADIFGHKAWYRSQLDGMIDYQNEQEAFFRKLGEIYSRSIQYWFHFLHSTYMPQVYLSLPRILSEDPEHYELLKILAGNYTTVEKIAAAEELYKRIWN